ncbi:HET-s/LopB domain protein [Talaromyces stipitatus ATCC 10500]|uniref:HET-s/LopB domain protein n=1 Tax=Talaromyces stipitatus (strain ATCC 10500 / CBS 375.48 / QM 6759 / NRRL 1006) TaxID=441959 RepID=B8M9C9_TALSN|nr:HET-s/LopB domain protein [Talaromyces stipitatus ATCC 10500]EED17689.1 HET-s/LopB domain protein [Talaromyces stipitatus ATCC 10500]
MDGRTQMRGDFDAVRNLYRHPDRQGTPGREFACKHDIYALKVVFLPAQGAQRTGKLPKAKEVYEALLSLAQLYPPNEIDTNYSTAVIDCLKGDFAQSSEAGFFLDFREKVIDRMSAGLKL